LNQIILVRAKKEKKMKNILIYCFEGKAE